MVSINDIVLRSYRHYKNNGLKSLIKYGYKNFMKGLGKRTPLVELYSRGVGLPMKFLLTYDRKVHTSQPESLPCDKVAILGRGPSLERVSQLKNLDFYVVNNFRYELNREPVQSVLYNKNIVLVGCASEPIIRRRDVINYNIIWYQFAKLRPNGESKWYKEARKNYNPEKIGLETDYLPSDVEKFVHKDFRKNTGLLSIIYTCYQFNPNEVYIIGFDFYENNDYHLGKISKDVAEDWKENNKTRRLKETMTHIAQTFSDTDFHIHTYSSYDPDLENVCVNNLNSK